MRVSRWRIFYFDRKDSHFKIPKFLLPMPIQAVLSVPTVEWLCQSCWWLRLCEFRPRKNLPPGIAEWIVWQPSGCQWQNQRFHALRLTLADRRTGHCQHHRQTQGNPHLHGFKSSHIVVLQLKVATDPGIDAVQRTAFPVQPLPSIGVPRQHRKGAKPVLVDLDAYDTPFCILANTTEPMALLLPGTPLTGAWHRTVKLLRAAFSLQSVIRHLTNLACFQAILWRRRNFKLWISREKSITYVSKKCLGNRIIPVLELSRHLIQQDCSVSSVNNESRTKENRNIDVLEWKE